MIRKGIVALVACLFAAGSPGAAQSAEFGSDEFHGLRFLLKSLGMSPVKTLKDLDEDVSRNVLIVLGDQTIVRENSRLFTNYVVRGGSVLVATHQMTRDTWKGVLGAHVTGEPVVTQVPNIEGYMGFERWPIVENFHRPPFRELKGVATYRPSSLAMDPFSDGVRVVARFPEGCGKREIPVFMMSREWENRRALILSTETVFSNAFVMNKELHNFEFTYRTLQWLIEGKRDAVMLIENGNIVPTFDIAMPLVPRIPAVLPKIDPPMPTVKAFNDMLQNVQRENLINRAILATVSLEQIILFLLFVATLALLFFGGRRIWKGTHHGTMELANAHTIAGHFQAGASLVDRRHREMVKNNNVWEAARDLARGFFAELYPGNPESAHAQPPRFKMRTGRAIDSQTRRLVDRLWQLAYQEAPSHVSLLDFTDLSKQLDMFRAKLRTGTIQVLPQS